jgi:hypothetical protein
MMSIVTEQKIKSFSRRVKPLKYKGVRTTILKAEGRRHRGGRSGLLSHDYVFDSIELELDVCKQESEGKDTSALKARLVMMRLRDKLLERSRAARHSARNRRRPSIKARLNRSSQLRDYIRMQEVSANEWKKYEGEDWY